MRRVDVLRLAHLDPSLRDRPRVEANEHCAAAPHRERARLTVDERDLVRRLVHPPILHLACDGWDRERDDDADHDDDDEKLEQGEPGRAAPHMTKTDVHPPILSKVCARP
jgi:hypothetical protein